MATNLTSNSFKSTYKDDYKDSDNYHRILFNSGKALQARELTQMQTIIQNEIERFGSNIFRDGGVVEPGGLSVNNRFEFIKLAANQLPADTDDIIGKTFTVASPDPQLKVKILKAVAASGSDPETLYVEYVSTSAGTAGTSTVRVGNGQVLENAALGSSYNMTTASAGAAGVGTEASIAKGSFFVQGHFVFVEKQSFFVDKYSGTPNEDIGFKIEEKIISVDDTNDLYDNQGAVANLAAPGADRYQIKLTLNKRSALAASDNFVYLAKLVNGRISDETRTDNSYRRLADTLALRTKEESGNYIVNPFTAKFEPLNDSNLTLQVTEGVVYVDGYRLQVNAQDITVPKAQETAEIEGETVTARYGNYVLVKDSDNKGFPVTTGYPEVTLRNAVDFGGSTIGTARVRQLEEDNDTLRLYLFDLKMNSGQNFGAVRSLGESAGEHMDIHLEGGIATLKNTAENDLLFPLPRTRPTTTLDWGAIDVQRRFTVTTGGSGTGTVSISDGTFVNANQWMVSPYNDDMSGSNSGTASGAGGTTLTVTGANNTTYDVYALVRISSADTARKAKVLTETTRTVTWPTVESDGSGTAFISLQYADAYNIKRLRIDDSDGADMKDNFIFDNGQRDNFYGIGRLIPKPGVTINSGTQIFTRYNYFAPTGGGHFYDISSYPTGVAYEDIPSHKLSDGTTVSLRDVLDFRPHAHDATGGNNVLTINFTGANSNTFDLPVNTDAVDGDVTYYMPRKDRLIATTLDNAGERDYRGKVKVVRGVSSFDPQFPEIPAGSMPLYNISMNPYTLNESDMTTSVIPAKRFTMSDISELEQRIDKLQELTTLSLLELNTSSLTVLDAAGLERTKAGFLVDNFKDDAFSDIERIEYRAGKDILEGLLTPGNEVNNTRLIYDSANSTSQRNGDIAILPIASHVAMIDQNLATETENINPFAVIVSNGHLEMSPASDEWVETQYAPDRVVSEREETTRSGTQMIARIRNRIADFRDRWIGQPINSGRVLVRGSVTTRREIIGDRILDVQFIDFMRSRKIFFRVNGLRRDTKHFMFFGGKNITDFARKETTFQRFASREDNPGNIFTNSTAHPDGTSDLLSDSVGELIGSFIIPSNSSLKFRTGTQRVELMDISSGNSDNAISKAQTTFTSTGVLRTRERQIETIRIQDTFFIQEYDPLAQSFRVDGADNPNGVFITKVDAYFSTKSPATDGIPVQCQIRPMENGIPTSAPLPGAIKFLRPDQVNIPSNLNNITTIRNTPTTFEFDEPIYLPPSRDYCIVLLADTTDYNVFVAKTYEFVVGSTEQRVNKQPTLGSMFMSQNGITWTPDQNRDLMFKLHRAQFSTSGTVELNNSEVTSRLLDPNPILTDSDQRAFRVFHPGHGFQLNDYVNLSGLDSSTLYAGIAGHNYMGQKQVIDVDHFGYYLNADSANVDSDGAATRPTASLRIGGTGVIATQNSMYDAFVPQIQTLLPDETSISATVKRIKGSSYGGSSSRHQSTHGAYANVASGTFKDAIINDFNFTTEPGLIANRKNEAEHYSNGRSFRMKLNLSTDDIKVSPVIDMQRMSVATFENIIDSGGGGSFNYIAETDALNGSAACKHVTKPVTLEEPAVGLKILFAANRPTPASFSVYYKTGTSDDNLDDIGYTLIAESTANPADDDGTTFRQYEFLPGGTEGTLNQFTKFQVKIVMQSTNSSKPPKIKDLRVIALVT